MQRKCTSSRDASRSFSGAASDNLLNTGWASKTETSLG